MTEGRIALNMEAIARADALTREIKATMSAKALSQNPVIEAGSDVLVLDRHAQLGREQIDKRMVISQPESIIGRERVLISSPRRRSAFNVGM